MALHRSLPLPEQGDLTRGFPDRNCLLQYLRQEFPAAAAIDGQLSPVIGGRKAAELALRRVDPLAYGRSRNFLKGAVTQLSPYIRHGLLGLAELKQWLVDQKRPWRDQEKLISELAWRDFWQRVWQQFGDGIWQNIEELKTGHSAESYGDSLPLDLRNGETKLACIDAFQRQLVNTGWLHNHARLWLAAYVVHWRRVRWQMGAGWFLQHLIDADPASNNLSWQWVASCFSAKPYVFNRANLEKYAGDSFCRSCAMVNSCPFDGSYEQIQGQLFIPIQPNPDKLNADKLQAESSNLTNYNSINYNLTNNSLSKEKLVKPLLWIHQESLGPANPLWRAWPEAPGLFVFDRGYIEHGQIGLKRLGFIYESLLELPLVLRNGDPVLEIQAFAKRCGCDGVLTQAPLDPHLKRIIAALQQQLPVVEVACDPFVDLPSPPQLQRFTKFWKLAEPLLREQFINE